MKITGTMINYYFFCKRKLWLFANGIKTEHESEDVKIGKYYHENKFKDEDSGDFINGVKLDKIEGNSVVEFKKSNSSVESAKWQLIFYLWKLKQVGINKKGILKFKENRDNIEVELDQEKEDKLKSIIYEIKDIIHQPTPPSTEFCSKKCNHSSAKDFNRV